MGPHGEGPGLVDRGQEATGGAIEGESSVLPGRALTQSRESLHVPPDRSGIRLVLLGQDVRLGGLLLRQIQSRRDRVKHRVTRRTEFLGDGPQEGGAIGGGVGVEGGVNLVERGGPRLLNRRPYVPAPEAGHVLKTPNHVIRATCAKQEEIQGEGGGPDITVPQDESAEQTGAGAVRGIV